LQKHLPTLVGLTGLRQTSSFDGKFKKPIAMQKTIFLSLFILISLSAFSTVLTVSQSVNLPAQYTTISAAISDAADGDTIYIHASASWYAPFVTLNKRLVLIGSGPHTRTTSGQSVLLQYLEFTAAASGSVINGLAFYNIIQGSGISGSTILNLTFRNCNFAGVNISFGFTSFIVENCIFSNGNLYFHPQGDGYRSGLIIRNNIFSTWGTSGDCSISRAGDNSIIDHNLFIGTNGAVRAIGTLFNCTVSNNIFYYRTIDTTGTYSSSGCTFLNNVTYQCTNTFPLPNNSGSGNIISNPEFVNFPLAATQFAYGYSYHTLVSSPAHNAATDGTDIGLYGGIVKFSITGEPEELPVIRLLDIYNTTVPLNGTLDIRMTSTVPVTD
jgi:hypothetical protein